METTRHLTTKVFIVNDGATALHYHPKLEIYLGAATWRGMSYLTDQV